MIRQPAPKPEILARRAEIVAGLRALLPETGLIAEDIRLKPYETDGLAAYRQPPLAVALLLCHFGIGTGCLACDLPTNAATPATTATPAAGTLLKLFALTFWLARLSLGLGCRAAGRLSSLRCRRRSPLPCRRRRVPCRWRCRRGRRKAPCPIQFL